MLSSLSDLAGCLGKVEKIFQTLPWCHHCHLIQPPYSILPCILPFSNSYFQMIPGQISYTPTWFQDFLFFWTARIPLFSQSLLSISLYSIKIELLNSDLFMLVCRAAFIIISFLASCYSSSLLLHSRVPLKARKIQSSDRSAVWWNGNVLHALIDSGGKCLLYNIITT